MSLEELFRDTDQAIMAAAWSETPFISQALAKEMEIVQSSSFFVILLSAVGRWGLQCDLYTF